MKLALEFMGMSPTLNSVSTAIEVVEMADVKNGGIAIDTYHFYVGPSTLQDLEKVPVSRILSVHLADGPKALTPAVDLDRRMPGEGDLPLSEFARVLTGMGFDGYWHVECIQGSDYASSLRETAVRALRGAKSVVEKE